MGTATKQFTLQGRKIMQGFYLNPEDAMRYRIERLPNGLIELFDYACKWSILFNSNGTYRHGGAGQTDAHREAVAKFLADEAEANWRKRVRKAVA